ncbi:MAG: hypothetical protein GC182_18020 [Rhodopseudomonas sp.]|nr:hypothetical protein [Rhodopseudomonas sp.]
MVNRVPVKPRAKSIRADLSEDGWHSVEPHGIDSLGNNHALSLWAFLLAICASGLAAFVVFGCHDPNSAVAILLSAAGMIAMLLSAGRMSGKGGWPI